MRAGLPSQAGILPSKSVSMSGRFQGAPLQRVMQDPAAARRASRPRCGMWRRAWRTARTRCRSASARSSSAASGTWASPGASSSSAAPTTWATGCTASAGTVRLPCRQCCLSRSARAVQLFTYSFELHELYCALTCLQTQELGAWGSLKPAVG